MMRTWCVPLCVPVETVETRQCVVCAIIPVCAFIAVESQAIA